MPGTLVAHQLSHSFPGTAELFSGLDLTVQAGEIVAVVGPSGSGKSTLLHILAGWEHPKGGTVERINIETVGWVFQNPHGVSRRDALDHVTLPLLARGMTRRAADAHAMDVLSLFQLSQVAHREFRHLSGGEAQRLMLARAHALAPDLLLVDEPTAQLDPATARTVNAVLAEMASAQVIVLVATHDPDTRDACSRIIDLANHAPVTK